MKVPTYTISTWYAAAAVAALLIACVRAAPQAEDGLNTEGDEHQKQGQRDEKLLVQLVHIPPTLCISNDNTKTEGTCLPADDCKNRGGTASGSCANGLGTCCLITKSCNTRSGLNNTFFVNPSGNSNDIGACSLTIGRVSSNICQLRLDFISLILSQPDIDGNCNTDFLTVTGGNNQAPMICGVNDGQHMYVAVDPTGGVIKVTVDRSTASTTTRTWNIKVSQIACDSRFRAPDGCLQYFTTTSGTVKSFNFADTLPALPSANIDSTLQMANLDYGVCIQRAAGYCGIIWERDTTLVYSFTVSGSVLATKPDLIGTPEAGTTGEACTTDYVIIPGGVDDLGKSSDRYCGLGFPKSVASSATPFVLFVKNDLDELLDESNRGFQLIYRQTTVCTTRTTG